MTCSTKVHAVLSIVLLHTFICCSKSMMFGFETSSYSNSTYEMSNQQPTTSTPSVTCCECQQTFNTTGCSEDPNCEANICHNDSYCCSTAWDVYCVDAAALLCSPDPTASPTTSIPTSDPTLPIIDTSIYTEVYGGSTCYSSTNFNLENYFHPPFNGTIAGIKLVHKNGSQTCDKINFPYTTFGCPYWGGFFEEAIIHLGDDSEVREVWYPGNNTAGFSGVNTAADGPIWVQKASSDCLKNGCGGYIWWKSNIYQPNVSEITYLQPSYNVTINTKLLLTNIGLCCNMNHWDNDGEVCVDVHFLYKNCSWVTQTLSSDSKPYFIGDTLLTFDDAETFCLLHSSHLASIHSTYQHNIAKELCDTKLGYVAGCWLGLSDIGSEGIYTYLDGTATDYGFIDNNPTKGVYPWESNSPDNHLGQEHCIHLWSYSYYEWNDYSCSQYNYPICNGIKTNTTYAKTVLSCPNQNNNNLNVLSTQATTLGSSISTVTSEQLYNDSVTRDINQSVFQTGTGFNTFIFEIIIGACISLGVLCIIDCLHSALSYKYDCKCCVANGCQKSDQYNFGLILIVLLRITDLITDIAITYTITKDYTNNNDKYQLILSCFSGASLIVPYIINIAYMFHIPKLKSILIDRPLIWFSKYMFIFVLITIITGDCYIATLIISSNIFGTNVFNAGLNRVQFNAIKHIKIINTMTESIPQIIIQAIYSYQNGLHALTILSLILSSITNITNIISLFMTQGINKKNRLIQCGLEVSFCYVESADKEYLKIIKYRGCTKRLRNKLCLTLGVEVSKLQIVCVDMKDAGFVINIIHTVIKNNESESSIQTLYDNKSVEINQIIVKIYDLECSIDSKLIIFSSTNSDPSTDNNLGFSMGKSLFSSSIRYAKPGDESLSDSIKSEGDKLHDLPIELARIQSTAL